MMEFIFEKIAERAVEISHLPEGVKNWMTFMRILFFSGIVFIPWFRPARVVVATMILTAIGIFGSKIFIPGFDTIAAGTIVQLVLWIPLLVYLMYILVPVTIPSIREPGIWLRVRGIWLGLVSVTIFASTALNIWNAVRWSY